MCFNKFQNFKSFVLCCWRTGLLVVVVLVFIIDAAWMMMMGQGNKIHPFSSPTQ